MLLDKSYKKIVAKLSVAATTNPCDFVTHYLDNFREQAPVISNNGTVNNGGTDIVPAPLDSYSREITEINIYNNDTVNAIVIIEYHNNAAISILKKQQLTPGQTLNYQRFSGWQVL
jgi:hypothetical protein